MSTAEVKFKVESKDELDGLLYLANRHLDIAENIVYHNVRGSASSHLRVAKVLRHEYLGGQFSEGTLRRLEEGKYLSDVNEERIKTIRARRYRVKADRRTHRTGRPRCHWECSPGRRCTKPVSDQERSDGLVGTLCTQHVKLRQRRQEVKEREEQRRVWIAARFAEESKRQEQPAIEKIKPERICRVEKEKRPLPLPVIRSREPERIYAAFEMMGGRSPISARYIRKSSWNGKLNCDQGVL